MFFIYYFFSILIGCLISFPIGPLGLLCVQRTLRHGFFKGFISGIGAALSDFTYGLIVLFAYNYIEYFLHRDGKYINLLLALIFIILGLKLLKSKDLELHDEFFHPMISSYFIGISNMGTIFIYLTIFTYFPTKLGINNFRYSIEILLLIFLGACLFWFFICETVSRWKNKFKLHHFILIDKIIGGIICTFGFINLFTFILNITRSNR